MELYFLQRHLFLFPSQTLDAHKSVNPHFSSPFPSPTIWMGKAGYVRDDSLFIVVVVAVVVYFYPLLMPTPPRSYLGRSSRVAPMGPTINAVATAIYDERGARVCPPSLFERGLAGLSKHPRSSSCDICLVARLLFALLPCLRS